MKDRTVTRTDTRTVTRGTLRITVPPLRWANRSSGRTTGRTTQGTRARHTGAGRPSGGTTAWRTRPVAEAERAGAVLTTSRRTPTTGWSRHVGRGRRSEHEDRRPTA